MTEKSESRANRLRPLFAAALTACPVSILTVALMHEDRVFSAGLVLLSLGAALTVTACLLAERP